MNYGDRIQWDHDGEVWPGRVTGVEPAGQANRLTVTLDTDGLSYDVHKATVMRERTSMNADSIKIESDEDGFHLIIDGDDPTGEYQAAQFDFNIHGCAEALHEQVNLIIGSWLAEGEAARHSVRVTREDLDAYEPNDPKRASLEILLDGRDEVFV